MSLETTYKFFADSVRNTIMGEASPYYEVKEVAKTTAKDGNNIRKEIKILINRGFIIEHPLNNVFKIKKYRVNREAIIRISNNVKNDSKLLAKTISNIP